MTTTATTTTTTCPSWCRRHVRDDEKRVLVHYRNIDVSGSGDDASVVELEADPLGDGATMVWLPSGSASEPITLDYARRLARALDEAVRLAED